MALPEILTVITKYLWTSKKVDIKESWYTLAQFTDLLTNLCTLKYQTWKCNALNIRHSEVSSLFHKFPEVKFRFRFAFSGIHCLLFRRFPESDIFVSISPENLSYKRTICFSFRVYIAKEQYIDKRWWNASLILLILADCCYFFLKWKHW